MSIRFFFEYERDKALGTIGGYLLRKSEILIEKAQIPIADVPKEERKKMTRIAALMVLKKLRVALRERMQHD